MGSSRPQGKKGAGSLWRLGLVWIFLIAESM